MEPIATYLTRVVLREGESWLQLLERQYNYVHRSQHEIDKLLTAQLGAAIASERARVRR